MNAAATNPPRYVCRSEIELAVWLEQYADMVDMKPKPGDNANPDVETLIAMLPNLDRAGRLMLQNRIIDRGMRDLLRAEPDQWRILHQYYRLGMWASRDGWIVPARTVGILVPRCEKFRACWIPGDHRGKRELCSRGKDCQAHANRFEAMREAAVVGLWECVCSRQEGVEN